MIEITSGEARAFLARLHFADDRNASADPVDALVRHVARLGCVQYDPLDVVGRNPDLVFQSRIEGYKPSMLYEALYERRSLFEGFDKNLAIFPREDFPCFARSRRAACQWFRENETITGAFDQVMEIVFSRGEVCSDDIPLDEKVDWPWGPTRLARAALESLWMAGRLSLSRREGARRFYAPIERCLPEELISAPDPHADDGMYYRWQAARRVRSVGLLTGGASDAFLGAGLKAARRIEAFRTLAEDGTLIPVRIADLNLDAYVSALDLDLLETAAEQGAPREARILAPLDNLLWDRKLIEKLFGFEYRWEVYVPKDKRKYGYYVLPVLCGDRFVARLEPAPFRGGTLQIRRVWWEDGIDPGECAEPFARCLDRFCAYLGAEGWRIEAT